MTDSQWAQIKHFQASEFHSGGQSVASLMDFQFMLKLDRIRERAGVPMVITSSHRSPAHNKAVGGAKDSAHEDVPCKAVDIGRRPSASDPNWNYARWKIVEAAIHEGITRIGIYPGDGSLHLDDTADRRPSPRIWIQVDNPA